MKDIKYIIILLASLAFMTSCDDEDKDNGIKSTAPVISPLVQTTWEIKKLAENENPFLFRLNWSKARFSYESGSAIHAEDLNYIIECDLNENNFADPVEITETTDLYTDMYAAELQELVHELIGKDIDKKYTIGLRVKATYKDQTVYSNIQPLTVTKTHYIYMIGDMNSWDNSNTDFMIFKDNSDAEKEIFTYTGKFAANTYFKFIEKESLGTNNMFCQVDDNTMEIADRPDGAFYNETEGYKTVTINLTDNTYSFEEYTEPMTDWDTINFVGAFCNWGENGEDPEMEQAEYDPHIWTLSITLDNIEYGVKFRADHNWGNKWCPDNPNESPYGLAKYNPAGHDNNINIDKQGAGDYYVKFNDITGHYIILRTE